MTFSEVPCDCIKRIRVHANYLEAIAMTTEKASLHYSEWERADFPITICTRCGQTWHVIPTGEHRCAYCVYLESVGIEVPQFGVVAR